MPSSSTNWIRTGLVVATAAALLVAVGLWGIPRSRTPVDEARFVHFSGNVTLSGSGETTIAIGGLLPHDALLTTIGDESFAVVRYDDGTQVTLAADTKLKFAVDAATGAKRLVLQEGFLTADVAKQPEGRPMLLSTPQAELVVLGTKFQLSGGSEATFVETSEGSVRLTRKSDGQSVAVNGGFEASVSDVAGPLAAQSAAAVIAAPRFSIDGIGPACLSPEGTMLLVAPYLAGDVQRWDVATGRRLTTVAAHRKRTVAVAFSQDAATYATASLDGTVKFWSWWTNDPHGTLAVGAEWIAGLAFDRDDRTLAVLAGNEGEEERRLMIWDLTTHEPRRAPLELLAQRWAFSPDGAQFAAYDRHDKLVRVWSLPAGELLASFRSPVGNNVFSLTFSRDGKTMAVDGSSGIITLCDVATGEVRRRLERRGGRIFGMTFSPDGRTLATGHQDGTIRFWNLETLTQSMMIPGRADAHARAIEFTRDGRTLLTHELRLATGDSRRDGAVHVWSVPTITDHPASLLRNRE